MQIGALTLFEKMHSNGTPIKSIVLAAWHWPSSITWRWSLAKSEYNKYNTKLFTFMRTYRGGKGFNFTLVMNSRFTDCIVLQTQPNMWKNKK